MDFRSLKFVATACAGEQFGSSPELLISHVCSDSRQARPGDLFFALQGERFDGHDFLPEAVQKGVAAVVVQRSRMPPNPGACAVIAVDDPRKALGRLAARYRADFDLPVIAVGGSNGKTSTKNMLAVVLRQKFETLASEASFNNDIGVPTTLLKLEKTHRAAVLEVGTNHPGELAPLVRMIQPRFGVITSIGREHLEFFGDLAGVAAEEGWQAELLPADGKLFVNGDSEWAEPLARRTLATVVRVGLGPSNDWRAQDVRLGTQGVSFRLQAPKPELIGEYRLNLLGRHQAANALFALAMGAELGLSSAELLRGLAECKPAKMRLQPWDWNGVLVLDDAYNANVDSMFAALDTLRELPCDGRRVAVLGDMGELGNYSPVAHAEVGRRAAESGADHLFAVGDMAAVTAQAARDAGLKSIAQFADALAAAEALKRFLKPGDVVLLKASRSARLERLAEALRVEAPSGKV
jgi:UDP-N-acetylmuramoyl-tripeptide--D-alanyl-D-alanine ligase